MEIAEKLSPTVSTVLSFGCLGISAAYFLGRFYVRRNFASIAIVCMISQGFLLSLVMNGDIPRRHFDFVRYFELIIAVFMLISIALIEFWDDYRRTVEMHKWRQQEDEELRRATTTKVPRDTEGPG